jgi:hypothetical protein
VVFFKVVLNGVAEFRMGLEYNLVQNRLLQDNGNGKGEVTNSCRSSQDFVGGGKWVK